MKKFGTIYIITNLINGKKYVGQTIQTVEKRFKQHKVDKRSGRHLHLSINSYGVNNFQVEEFMSCFDQSSLDFYETLAINTFNTMTPSGYNLCKGGANKGEISESTREKMSLAKKGKPQTTKRFWNEESKLAISKKRGGKPIIAMNRSTGEVKRYDYVNQACKDGFLNSEIYAVLKGNSRSHKNHIFYYVDQSGSSEVNNSEHAQRIGIEPAKAE